MPVSVEVQNFIDQQDQESGNAAEIKYINQKEVFSKGGAPLYLLPSYGWDGGSPIGITHHNLKRYESIDFLGGPGAELWGKIDKTKEAAAYYDATSESMSEVFVFA